jgi:kynurenine formamidase
MQKNTNKGQSDQSAAFIEGLQKILSGARIIDLSRTMETGMPTWPTQARYGSVVYESWETGAAALHSMITLSEHTGTHIDAPKHFIPGGKPIDEVPILLGRGVTMTETELGPSGLLPLQSIKDFEAEYGPILKGDIVMFRFGWDEKYGLAGSPGADAYLKDWPGLSAEAAEYLAGKETAAVGCDTLAIDAAEAAENPAHYVLLGKGIPIIENINNLSLLPPFSFVMGFPNKFKGGSGSPIRLAALLG